MSNSASIPAPIVLFVYNRPHHTKRTIESLSFVNLIDRSELYIFSDGPKNESSEQELNNIKEVREYIATVNFAKRTRIFMSDKNKGLAESVIHGINTVFNDHDRLIAIEDDVVLQKGFLDFLNDALTIYENDSRVMHIGAYMHKIKGKLPDTAFLKLMICSGGWATWKRAWQLFNPDASYLLSQFSFKKKWSFDYGRSFNYYRMLKKNVQGKNDSWAIRWYASIFLKNGLCYNPTKSLFTNIGHDGSGTHSFNSKSYQVNQISQIKARRIEIKENKKVRRALIRFFWKLKVMELPVYLQYLIRKEIHKLKSN